MATEDVEPVIGVGVGRRLYHLAIHSFENQRCFCAFLRSAMASRDLPLHRKHPTRKLYVWWRPVLL